MVARTAAGFATLHLRGARLLLGLLAQGRQAPDFHGPIADPRDQEPASGAECECHAADHSRVTAEAVDCLGVAVPDFHGLILLRPGDPPTVAVGAERRRPDIPAMSREGPGFPIGL